MRAAAASVVLAVVAVLAVLIPAAPASAHADLVSTDPEAGASLDALPVMIVLTFTDAPLPGAGITYVSVKDAAGRSLTKGAPVVEGTVVTQRLAGPASGAIDVVYKVVTSDGHPTTGEFGFTVAGTAPTATATPDRTPEPAQSAAASEDASAPAPWEPTPAPAAAGPGDVIPLLAILTVLFAALVGAVVVLLRAMRSRRGDPGRSDPDSDR